MEHETRLVIASACLSMILHPVLGCRTASNPPHEQIQDVGPSEVQRRELSADQFHQQRTEEVRRWPEELGLRGTSGGSVGEQVIGLSSLDVLRCDEIEIRSDLDQLAVRRVVGRHLNEIKRCYVEQLKSAATKGSVAITFTIGAEGRVTTIHLASSTLNRKEVEGCIIDEMRRWRFPGGAGSVWISFPFAFRSPKISGAGAS